MTPATPSTLPTAATNATSVTSVVPAGMATLIQSRQTELGMTDRALCVALGFEREIVLTLIKQGTMKLPIDKVPALAAALVLDPSSLLRDALRESAPGMLAVIEAVYNPLQLTTTEENLIKHLRQLTGNQKTTPLVFEGQGIVALVMP